VAANVDYDLKNIDYDLKNALFKEYFVIE